MPARKYAHAQDLRKGRWSATGQIYHITICTRQREPVFRDFQNARRLIGILRGEEDRRVASTLAFVIMPDHLHWLMQLEQGELSVVVGRVKSLTARLIGRPVWQQGFHDHALRREDDIRDIARYIVANPLRAGLVGDIRHYPHWGAIWL